MQIQQQAVIIVVNHSGYQTRAGIIRYANSWFLLQQNPNNAMMDRLVSLERGRGSTQEMGSPVR